MERWKKIKNYEGLYEISSFGRVRSLARATTRGGILKQNKSRFYLSVCLSKENYFRTFSVHRLVAKHFIPNPKNKPYVNHKNGDRFDNRIENLEWVTPSENKKHAVKNGLTHSPRGEEHWASKLTEKQVIKMRLKKGHKKLREIAEEYGVSIQLVSDILNRKRWKHI
ncbi:MAG TPA: endonuclease [Candidatus Scalindua sp.]|nr:endonuclease [Candidatus Scalindua sp.]